MWNHLSKGFGGVLLAALHNPNINTMPTTQQPQIIKPVIITNILF
jgi:hypothetical protein